MAGEKPKRRHKTNPPPLTLQEIRFCQLYADTGNATRACIDAKFSSATVNSAGVLAFKLLRKAKVRAYIRELQIEACDAAQVRLTTVAQGLRRTAFSDVRKLFDERGALLPPSEWPDEIAAAVESVDTDDIFEMIDGEKVLVGYSRKVRFAKRTEAMKVLARWVGMIDGEAHGEADASPRKARVLVIPSNGRDGTPAP